MTQQIIRTRFAPSPTGYMHVGNLRTALYAYLLAKKDGGSFILRIEDTDQERYVEGAVDLIYRTMRETGLNYDEGPDIGGDFGPYIQSERREFYREYAEKLVNKGEAYYCFCSQDRLDDLRAKSEGQKQTYRYDRHCLSLPKEEIEKYLDENRPYVIRQEMPTEGITSFDDAVFGTISINNSELEDQILLKSDGLPTYNFANVVDDHLMNITHIIRGSEYLTSTPKYNLLYKAFGWDIPLYIHASPVMKDANKKLSKRDGDASYEDFINKGYLKDAIINYIALLGWSPGGEREIFSLEELVQAFDIKGISKSPAIFDVNKLNWLNGEYIKKLTLEEFHQYAIPYYKNVITIASIDLAKVSELLHARTEKFSDIPEMVDFIDVLPEYETDLYFHKKMKTDLENSLSNLKEMLSVLEIIDDNEWNKDNVHEALFVLIEKLGVKNGQVLWPLRVALSGKPTTPGGGIELADILGKDESIHRIKKGIELLEVK